MTALQTVYDAFLAKILDDEWSEEEQTDLTRAEDWQSILDGAIPRFKFPRISLAYTGLSFNNTLTNNEIQVLATYMKCVQLERNILTWENIKPMYSERDFSPANLLDKLHKLLEYTNKQAEKFESIYYRSVDAAPRDWSKLYGK